MSAARRFPARPYRFGLRWHRERAIYIRERDAKRAGNCRGFRPDLADALIKLSLARWHGHLVPPRRGFLAGGLWRRVIAFLHRHGACQGAPALYLGVYAETQRLKVDVVQELCRVWAIFFGSAIRGFAAALSSDS